jgi:hypothetical protein
MSDDKGVFTISLDTELAWGAFDKGNVDRYEDAYRNTPEVINRLCDLFDEYEIPATWAVVSHLLESCDGDHSDRLSPDFEWVDDWFGELPCASGMDEDARILNLNVWCTSTWNSLRECRVERLAPVQSCDTTTPLRLTCVWN